MLISNASREEIGKIMKPREGSYKAIASSIASKEADDGYSLINRSCAISCINTRRVRTGVELIKDYGDMAAASDVYIAKYGNDPNYQDMLAGLMHMCNAVLESVLSADEHHAFMHTKLSASDSIEYLPYMTYAVNNGGKPITKDLHLLWEGANPDLPGEDSNDDDDGITAALDILHNRNLSDRVVVKEEVPEDISDKIEDMFIYTPSVEQFNRLSDHWDELYNGYCSPSGGSTPSLKIDQPMKDLILSVNRHPKMVTRYHCAGHPSPDEMEIGARHAHHRASLNLGICVLDIETWHMLMIAFSKIDHTPVSDPNRLRILNTHKSSFQLRDLGSFPVIEIIYAYKSIDDRDIFITKLKEVIDNIK